MIVVQRDWSMWWRKVEALAWLCLTAVAINLLPFRYFSRWMIGRTALPAITPPPPFHPLPDPLLKVGQAVHRAAQLLPFPTLCLVQAVAARRMLARHHHDTILHLSVRMGNATESAAHAWLTYRGVAVIGNGLPRGQIEIAHFT